LSFVAVAMMVLLLSACGGLSRASGSGPHSS
jgi:hypothetical protein